MHLEHASRVIPKEGEKYCGDAVFARNDEKSALFVLIDALGHGDAAYDVAQLGLAVLSDLPSGTDAMAALTALNARLHGTRGAVATACSFNNKVGQVVGVGNVLCRAVGFRLSFVPKPGLLGFRNAQPVATQVELGAGQALILHSDGVSQRFLPDDLLLLAPDAACEQILNRHRYRHDDAGVLVIGAKSRFQRAR